MISTWSGQFLTLGFVGKKCANSSVEFSSEWFSFPLGFCFVLLRAGVRSPPPAWPIVQVCSLRGVWQG
jgi:hypothetical protein